MYTVQQLLEAQAALVGAEVTVSGRLASRPQERFWLVQDRTGLDDGEAVRVDFPNLIEIVFETVPFIGGGLAYYHPSIATGVLRLVPGGRPALELTALSRLDVSLGDRTYRLLGS